MCNEHQRPDRRPGDHNDHHVVATDGDALSDHAQRLAGMVDLPSAAHVSYMLGCNHAPGTDRHIILAQLLKAIDEIDRLKRETEDRKPALAFRLPEPPEPGMVPCAHSVQCDGWILYWKSEDGRRLSKPEIPWPFAGRGAATAADMERIGFRVTS